MNFWGYLRVGPGFRACWPKIQHWAERERQEGHKEGHKEGQKVGHKEGRQQADRETALQRISIGLLKDSQIAQATGLSLAQIEARRSEPPS